MKHEAAWDSKLISTRKYENDVTFKFLETLGKWLFSLDRNKKRLIQICLDFALVFVSLSLALFVRLEDLDFFREDYVYFALLILLTTTMLVFWIRGQYNVFVRYSSFETIVTTVVATSLASSLLPACPCGTACCCAPSAFK